MKAWRPFTDRFRSVVPCPSHNGSHAIIHEASGPSTAATHRNPQHVGTKSIADLAAITLIFIKPAMTILILEK